MTPIASAARSPRRVNPLARRAGLLLLGGVAALTVGQYLAGYFFLWSVDLSPRQATPLTTLRYYHFYGHVPDIRRRLLWCSVLSIGFVASTLGAVAWPKPRPLHGAARFARRREIVSAGLLGDHGLILGEYGNRYLMLDGQQGIAIAAPPRSGKGVGIVVPNLLHWPGSAIVLDIKREAWTLTAGYRQAAGQEVHLYDPLSESGATARSNPFTYVPSGLGPRVNGVQRIAGLIFPDTPGTDPFWIAGARSLFLGLALYAFETPSIPTTIGEVLRQGMASDDEGFGAHWRRIIAGRQSGRHPLSPACVRALSDIIDLAPVTASSIRKTFTSRLDLWLNPILDAATSGNDFDLRELRRRPMTIYVGANPDDLHRLRPVLSLFFEQALGLQTRALPEHDPSLRLQLAVILDEVAALGLIPIVAESISYLPGYNVRLALIFHAVSQLRQVYGIENAKTMLKSLAARIYFPPKDYEEAKELSDELGNTTVKVRSISKPYHLLGGRGHRGMNQTMSEQRRPLLLPQEVKELGTDRALVFCEGLRPILCRKIRYYEDPRFRARLLPPPLQPTVAATMAASAPHAASDPEVPSAPASQEASAVIFRDATLEDIEQIDSLTSADFEARFDHIQLPEDRTPTLAELQKAADEFLAAL